MVMERSLASDHTSRLEKALRTLQFCVQLNCFQLSRLSEKPQEKTLRQLDVGGAKRAIHTDGISSYSWFPPPVTVVTMAETSPWGKTFVSTACNLMEVDGVSTENTFKKINYF